MELRLGGGRPIDGRPGDVSPVGVSVAASRVARTLLSEGPRTAPELASALALTVQAVRRHLDHLVAMGFVDSHERPPFGPAPRRGRGRPPRVYAITDEGRAHLDQSYDDLALGALRFLSQTGGESLVRDFAVRRAEEFQQRHRDRIERADDPIGELAAVMTEEGFAAEIVEDTAGLPGVQVCQHHCPVAAIASEFPQLCEAEAAAIGELLGRNVTRLATIAHGDGICTTHVSPVNRSRTTPNNTRRATA